MSRITWQNVAAPDFSDALEGTRNMGVLVGSGFEGLADIAAKMRQRQKAERSNAAMAEAMKLTEGAAFEQALQRGGIQGFGVNSRDMTAEALEFFRNRGGELLTNDGRELLNEGRALSNTGLQIGNRQAAFDLEQDRYGQNRTEIADGRADLAYDRSEATLETQAQAQALAQEVAKAGRTRDQSLRQIRQSIEDPVLLAATEAAIKGLGDEWWSVSDTVAGSGNLRPEFRVIGDELSARESAINSSLMRDQALSLYMSGMDRFGEGGEIPAQKLIELGQSTVTGTDGESTRTLFEDSPGEIVRSFDTISREFSNLPPQLVAEVMMQNLTSADYRIQSTEDLGFAMKRIRAVLGQFDGEDRMAGLEQERAAITAERDAIGYYQKQRDIAIQSYERAMSRGDTEAAQKALAQAAALGEKLVPPQPAEESISRPEARTPFDPAASGFSLGSQPVPQASGFQITPTEMGGPRTPEMPSERSGPPPQPANVDPRVSTFTDGVREGSNQLARGLNWTVGDAVGGLNQTAFTAMKGPVLAYGMIDPEGASNAMNWLDNAIAGAGELSEEGILSIAQRDPVKTVEAVISRTDVPPAVAQRTKALLEALRTNPDDVQRRALLTELKGHVQAAQRIYEKSGTQDPVIEALVNNPEEWLTE